ncbi:hypothetical protein DPMN_007630 [Dreissena polymorpha]|uniref:Uncharacterized protein n=1 Tax=Dreissena polymorpha TaxID=45954 RepID=A0A9D4MUP0_DREPO|nr:hypothetical protein DPMN_007630 [Dreissena polymorpha]
MFLFDTLYLFEALHNITDYFLVCTCINCLFQPVQKSDPDFGADQLAALRPRGAVSGAGNCPGEIKTLQISQEASIQSLQRTYNEHREVMIEQMCGNLNTYIDKCDNNSVGTSGGNEQYLKEEMCRNVVSILNEFNNITAKELNEMKDEVISIKGSVTRSIHKCTSVHNDLSHFHEIVQKIGDHKQLCLIASIKCKHIIQQALTLLGKSGKVFKVQRKSVHNVRIPSDSNSCYITGICALPDGQVLVADRDNKRVKLLSQQYKVVSHWDVNAEPQDICQITPSEVAVLAVNISNIHGVQFITVNQGKLVPGRKFQLQHECRFIAHHQGDLFVTSVRELYKYTLNGKLICRLYEIFIMEVRIMVNPS